MKKLLIIALAIGVLCVLLAGLSFADEAKKAEVKKPATPAGQKVFTEAKCQMCHTVLSAGIGEAPAEDAEEEEEAGPPDLSAAGTGRTAEWLSLFMQKKEALNDKKHMQKFKGSDEDLTALVDWLATLKPVEKKAAPKAEKAAGTAAEKAAPKAEKAAGTAAEKAAEDDAAEKAAEGDATEKAAEGDAAEKAAEGDAAEKAAEGDAAEKAADRASHEGHDHGGDDDDDGTEAEKGE